MQILYADVLFAVNLSMDFLTLYLTGRVLHRPLRPGRLLAASVLGGLYGVFSLFLESYALLGLAVHLGVSFLICYLAYGRPLLTATALFYGIGCLLGGIMTAVFTALNRFRPGGSEQELPSAPPALRPSPIWLALLAALCGLGALAFLGVARRRSMATEASLLLAWEEKRWHGRGIVDSANFLTEPVSGTPVILLPKSDGKALLPSALFSVMAEGNLNRIPHLPSALARKVRLIPMATAGGQSILIAVRPDRCEINGSVKSVFIGLGDLPGAMIPSDLIKEAP